MFNPMNEITTKITSYTNAHSHLDRAYTIKEKDFYNSVGDKHLFQKWELVNQIKIKTSKQEYFERIYKAVQYQYDFFIKNILSFIDVDDIVEDKAIKAAFLVKEIVKNEYGVNLILANQTVTGFKNKKTRNLIEKNLDKIDVLGGLPKVEDFNSHINYLFGLAKSTNKRVHVHVDQLNTKLEKETEMLARKTIEFGLEGMVTAVHSISLATHNKAYRNEVYKIAKDAGLSFITCPTAWIDHKRTEELTVNHNAITPVDELLENDLLVGIGTDNIHDIYKPFSNGDILTEAKFLIECLHLYDVKEIINILTVNSEKIIGLKNEK